ncbi:MAG: tRNA uridine-5-carboxymethylaminomethyl(34) synthesis GTPase MnmE, partial [Bacteroidales bacterium]|nr:tRNA uridine-5-carboxymethylaminomethyl(34) synthesis GTPase MnmE [Bacteroidales bacterium]
LSNNQTENIVLLLNKSDLSEPKTRDFPVKTINISVKTQQNIDLLKTYLVDSLKAMKFEENDVIISNIRHLSALQNALEALNRAQEAMRQGLPGDLLSQDVREAIHYLGAITGEIGTEEVLGTIFQNFCIGK